MHIRPAHVRAHDQRRVRRGLGDFRLCFLQLGDAARLVGIGLPFAVPRDLKNQERQIRLLKTLAPILDQRRQKIFVIVSDLHVGVVLALIPGHAANAIRQQRHHLAVPQGRCTFVFAWNAGRLRRHRKFFRDGLGFFRLVFFLERANGLEFFVIIRLGLRGIVPPVLRPRTVF